MTNQNKSEYNLFARFKLMKLCAASAIMLTGCANTISSISLNEDPISEEGLSYYLPMRHMQVTVERRSKSQKANALETDLLAKKLEEQTAETTKNDQQKIVDRLSRELTILEQANDSATTIAAKKLELAKSKAALDLDSANLRAARESTRIASETLQRALTDPEGSFSEEIQLTTKNLVPDPSRRFVAKLNHSQFRNDNWNITTTESGLLQTANVSPSGQLDEILGEVAKTVIVLTGSIAPGIPPTDDSGERVAEKDEDPCGSPFRFEMQFDPVNEKDVDLVNGQLASLCSNFRVKVVAPNNANVNNTVGNVDGLAYRREIPFTVEVWKCRMAESTVRKACFDFPKEFYPHRTTTVLLPNGAPIESIAFEADAFAANTLNSTFANGMLTSVSFSQPSGVLAVAQTPLNVVSTATTALGDLLTLRVNSTQNKNQLLQNETESLNDLVNRLRAQQTYDAALKDYLEGNVIPDAVPNE